MRALNDQSLPFNSLGAANWHFGAAFRLEQHCGCRRIQIKSAMFAGKQSQPVVLQSERERELSDVVTCSLWASLLAGEKLIGDLSE